MGNFIRSMAHAVVVIGGTWLLAEAIADLRSDKRALEDECDRLAKENEKLQAKAEPTT